MLSRLSIRDIVLIERLDIDYAAGMSVLTGETGAGKSILLDAFALALGSRGDASLVRNGAEQGQVTAAFDVDPDHPAIALLNENGIGSDDGLIMRRVQLADGRTRAFINDQPVSVQILKSLGAALVEIHGQHDERALVDVATHRRLLDAYAGLEDNAAVVAHLWAERLGGLGENGAGGPPPRGGGGNGGGGCPPPPGGGGEGGAGGILAARGGGQTQKAQPGGGGKTGAGEKAPRNEGDRKGRGGF